MDVYTAVKWIHDRKKFSDHPGLTRVQHLLHLLGNPERELKVIHISGTNGKGSTVAYLDKLFQALDYKVGTYTSPYIEAFNERICINGKPISDSALIQLIRKVQPLVAEMDKNPELTGITEFEITTAMMFDYFATVGVDIAILEAGIGGMYDSTNVVSRPLVTAISTIDYDHCDILGPTIADITKQKAGIFKPEVPVVLGALSEEAKQLCVEYAKSLHCPTYCYDEDYHVQYTGPSTKRAGERFNYRDSTRSVKRVLTPLIGHHQVENAAFALEIFDVALKRENKNLSNSDVQHAMARVEWPGRMEIYQNEPLIILDGAHNVPAMKRLVETLNEEYKDYDIHVLFGSLCTKDYNGAIHELEKLNHAEITLTTFDLPKAVPTEAFSKYENVPNITISSHWRRAFFEMLKDIDDEKEMVVVTGSLYFVSEVRQFLMSGLF